MGGALLLGGCGSETTPWRDYFQILGTSLQSSMAAQMVTRDQAANVPYASLGYRVNGGHQGMLVLATDTGGDQLWTSAARVVLLTRGGRIMRSVGLPRDRTATTVQRPETFPSLAEAVKRPVRSTRMVDMPDIGVYSQLLNCLATARRRELITVLGTPIVTIRIDESCQGSNPRWIFTDNYWIDPDTGFVWRSVQNLHPSGVKVETVIFRPPE